MCAVADWSRICTSNLGTIRSSIRTRLDTVDEAMRVFVLKNLGDLLALQGECHGERDLRKSV